jgi:glycosyltransferase involved in cell wall biosynthesis
VSPAPHSTAGRDIFYVDGTIMMPTLRRALVEPAGIARAGLEIVSSFLLEPSVRSRLLVADRGSRRLYSFDPGDRTSELGLMREISRIARSMPRSRLRRVSAFARDLVTLGKEPWRLPPELTTGAGGVFLFAGMNMKSGFLESLKLAQRRHGLRIVWYLHDLLPFTHPDDEARTREFLSFLARFIACCDLVVTSSRYTASRLPEAVARTSDAPLPPITTVPLAHEYRPWQTGSHRPELPGLADDFVLCVGDIRDRKNQVRLLSAWQRYRSSSRRSRPVHLVLAGTLGPGSDKVVDFLAQTRHVDGTVHLLPAPGDPELTWLYENCRFTTYVSVAEGFGLPIGESLWLGKTCLASTATSMPEVGGDLVAYADPNSIDEIETQLRRMLDEDGYLARLESRITRSRLRSWRDFRSDLVETVRARAPARS